MYSQRNKENIERKLFWTSSSISKYLSVFLNLYHSYPRRGGHHTIGEEEQVQSHRLEDVLENGDHLKSQHVLSYVVTHLSNV